MSRHNYKRECKKNISYYESDSDYDSYSEDYKEEYIIPSYHWNNIINDFDDFIDKINTSIATTGYKYMCICVTRLYYSKFDDYLVKIGCLNLETTKSNINPLERRIKQLSENEFFSKGRVILTHLFLIENQIIEKKLHEICEPYKYKNVTIGNFGRKSHEVFKKSPELFEVIESFMIKNSIVSCKNPHYKIFYNNKKIVETWKETNLDSGSDEALLWNQWISGDYSESDESSSSDDSDILCDKDEDIIMKTYKE